MQVSKVISGFCLVLMAGFSVPFFACATDAGLPDDIMTETKPVGEVAASPTPAAKPAAKKEAEKKSAPAKAKDAVVKKESAPSVDDAAVTKLKNLDSRYQKAKSVSMNVERNLVMGMLGKEKKSKGTLLLSKGKMRMELTDPEKSLVVIDGKTLWVADYPPAEFKNAAVQVLKGQINSKKGANQGFVTMLTRGGVLSQFKVTGFLSDPSGRGNYYLQPKQSSVEFKRAELVISADGKSIERLSYWDERDNKTDLTFSNVKFDEKLDAKAFQFSPPENSDITSI